MTTDEIEEITRQIDRLAFADDTKEAGTGKGSDATENAPRRYRHVLVGIDGSEGSQKAVDWGVFIAGAHDAKMTVALVLPPMHPISDRTLTAANPASARLWKELAGAQEKEARRVLDEAVRPASKSGVKATTRLARGPAAPTLGDIAKEDACDLIVVGSHGRRGMKRFLLGSVAEAVKDHAPADVLIARNRPPQRQVLLPVDGSAQSKRAAVVLTGLMEEEKTRAHVVHVVHAPVEGLSKELHDKWMRATEDLRRPLLDRVKLPRGSWVHYDLFFGQPADEILAAAEEDEAGLIVMGHRGLSGVRALIAGSVSGRVARHASASVLLVK